MCLYILAVYSDPELTKSNTCVLCGYFGEETPGPLSFECLCDLSTKLPVSGVEKEMGK